MITISQRGQTSATRAKNRNAAGPNRTVRVTKRTNACNQDGDVMDWLLHFFLSRANALLKLYRLFHTDLVTVNFLLTTVTKLIFFSFYLFFIAEFYEDEARSLGPSRFFDALFSSLWRVCAIIRGFVCLGINLYGNEMLCGDVFIIFKNYRLLLSCGW